MGGPLFKKNLNSFWGPWSNCSASCYWRLFVRHLFLFKNKRIFLYFIFNLKKKQISTYLYRTVELQNSVDVSATHVKELISQPPLEPLSTTETPSDSTPEIFYNESFEQDALTILPTYRTPQYSNLQFLWPASSDCCCCRDEEIKSLQSTFFCPQNELLFVFHYVMKELPIFVMILANF